LSTSDFLNKSVVVASGAKQVYQFSNRKNVGANMFITKHEEQWVNVEFGRYQHGRAW
jgi:hypothetical protein